MSINSLPQLLAGMQPGQFFFKFNNNGPTAGRPQSFFAVIGCPAQGAANTTLGGATYTNVGNAGEGQIFRNEPAGSNTAYLAKFLATVTGSSGTVLLCDRLWDNGGITITSTAAQTINSPTWPARDANGQTNGVGIYLGVEVSAVTGAGSPTITISYTNSAGTAGQSATNQDATASSAAAGDFFRMKLAAGDVGVQSVQSITLSATWTSGTIHVVAYRIIAIANVSQIGNCATGLDPVTSGLPVVFNGSFLFLATVPPGAGVMSVSGLYVEAQG